MGDIKKPQEKEFAKWGARFKPKNCDWIISNDVSRDDIGFGSEMNEVSIYYSNNKIEKIKKSKKSLIASQIVKKLINELKTNNGKSSN